ncbi:MAG: hypothetical protein KatS3mg002_1653 [Candidatus Woesearchaeota archaeon]|nr:MAG: hypothetical protein KatS3mg002_1653 [Candidatus Woesearchaeota archaeon]
MAYEQNLKYYRDLKNVIDKSFQDRLLKGKIEVARNIKNKGLSLKDISEITALTIEGIENLLFCCLYCNSLF